MVVEELLAFFTILLTGVTHDKGHTLDLDFAISSFGSLKFLTFTSPQCSEGPPQHLTQGEVWILT